MSPMIPGTGASRRDVEEVVAKLDKKLTRSGRVTTMISIGFTFVGAGIEVFIKADYGFIFIALGVLGIGIGLTLWRG
jgi:hypothetical protein